MVIVIVRSERKGIRTALIGQLSPQIFLFFPREKQEKHEIFLKFENLTEGKIFWRASLSNISKIFLKTILGYMEIKQNARKSIMEI